MYFIAALALIFYVSKVPERYFPGETTWIYFGTQFFFGYKTKLWHCLPCCLRSAELPGLQPPGVASAAGSDVLLVAPVVGFHHGVQTQSALPRRATAHLGHRATQRDPTPNVRWQKFWTGFFWLLEGGKKCLTSLSESKVYEGVEPSINLLLY